ncbi:MAG TPA: riboflavin synthase subunit alpha [SAR86 cluster bacterium]|nr:riboflavin synthase subunit alpha [SAR86 cluster bacterium]|tara:strand:- start:22289 stop:22891 length:603 start_codon:yes stop_codon:yes gene_type:complete
MFTGIIQEVGEIRSAEETQTGLSIEVSVKESFTANLLDGASVSVNGVCLTAVGSNKNIMFFDVIKETLRVTNLDEIKPGAKVNLERSLKYGDEIGGHIVSGHVSCKGKSEILKNDGEVELRIECPPKWLDYIYLKGFVAINGASLTVAKKEKNSFSVFLIPETLGATNLSEVNETSMLNIEVDQSVYSTDKASKTELAQC